LKLRNLLKPKPNPRQRLRPSADWAAPRATIVIVGAPRSGTTLLCSLMAATNRLGRPGEFFNEDAKEFANPHGPDDTAHRLTVARKSATANGVLALKLFPGHLDRAMADLHLWEFFPEPAFVRVTRRDLLRQAISLARAWQTDQWNSLAPGARAQPVYSSDAIERGLALITNENAQWDRFFARYQVSPMMVEYEDLEQRAANIVQIIAKVELETIPTIDDSPLTVQRDDLTEQWREAFLAEGRRLERI